MKLTTRFALTLVAAAMSSLAFAGNDSGFYIGGSAGSAAIDYSGEDISFDDSDTSYKVFAGYNFGLIPAVNLAAEVAYSDFGSIDGEIMGHTGNTLDITAMTVSGLVGFNLGPVGIFGKAGFFTWDTDLSTVFGDVSDDGSDPAYGVGAQFQLGSIAIRAEYEPFTRGYPTNPIDYLI